MRAFRAMGTEIAVTACGDEAAIAARVHQTFAAAERRFSRFDADSELSRLNRAEGPFPASPELFAALVRARGYVALTGGIFDPGVGGAVIAAGYDRPYAPGALDRAAPAAPGAPCAGSLRDVALDEGRGVVTRPPHVRLDLGGMIKGATVDRAATQLGACGAIDAGGDAYLRGTTPAGERWLVEVEDPRDPARTVVTVAVTDAAVATSAANRRRWRRGDRWAHHLIDPRTRRCASEDLLQATVLAPTTELADVLAKTAFILGARAAIALLAGVPRVAAVLVPRAGPPILLGPLDVREGGHA